MKNLTYLLILLFIFSSCGEDEDLAVCNTQEFSSEHFQRFDEFLLNAEDAELADDGSIVLAGNGSEANGLGRTPFFMSLAPDNQIAKLDFLDIDDQFTFRHIDLLPAQDGEYIYLSQSSGTGFPTDINADIRKLTATGEIQWTKSIGELTRNERGVSITQLPNGDYVFISTVDQELPLADKFLVTRITELGEVIWSKIFAEESGLRLRKVVYVPADQSILMLHEFGLPMAVDGKIRITKLDTDGNVLASKLIVENRDFFPLSSDLKLLNDGSVLVYFSIQEEGASNDYEIQLNNLTIDLTEVWNRSFSEIKSNIISDVIETSDANLVLLSNASVVDADGEFDVILTKADTDGVVLWRKVFSTTGSDQGLCVKERMNKDLVIVGNTNHNIRQGDNFDLFLIDTDAEGNPK